MRIKLNRVFDICEFAWRKFDRRLRSWIDVEHFPCFLDRLGEICHVDLFIFELDNQRIVAVAVILTLGLIIEVTPLKYDVYRSVVLGKIVSSHVQSVIEAALCSLDIIGPGFCQSFAGTIDPVLELLLFPLVCAVCWYILICVSLVADGLIHL